jgi:hypothetical protein
MPNSSINVHLRLPFEHCFALDLITQGDFTRRPCLTTFWTIAAEFDGKYPAVNTLLILGGYATQKLTHC